MIEELSSFLSPFKPLLSSSSLSAAKILERAEDQFHHQLQHMLTDHETLQRRDEIHNKNTGARDTIIPFQLSKWAFLTFLVAGCICWRQS